MATTLNIKNMTQFSKIHKNRTALKAHAARIVKRGGTYTTEMVKGGWKLKYSFKK